MSRPFLRIAATLVVVSGTLGFGAPQPAQAQAAGRTLYVSTTGNDAAAGSSTAPWRTLRHGMEAVQPGDSLLVRGGTYRERLSGMTTHAGTAQQPVKVTAAPGERPVLRGILELDAPDYWTVQGINVEWDAETGKADEHMVRILDGHDWRFEDAELSGARSFAAILVGGTKGGQPANWALTGNCIHDTQSTNGANQDQLVYVNSGLDAGDGLIEHNILFGAHNGAGVKLGGPDPGTGGAAHVTVEFNTIYDTVQSVLVSGGSHDNTVDRNILAGTGRANGVVRAFQLTGERNALTNNVASGADRLVFSDKGYRGLDGTSGNRFPVNPRFDSVGGCGGFHPRNPAAAAYGRHAVPAPAATSAPRRVSWLPFVLGAAAVLAAGAAVVVVRRR